MKIIIVNPPAVKDITYIREGRCEQRLSSFQYSMVPISLPSIAAILKRHGFEVKIIDCITSRINGIQLAKLIAEFRPELIIINVSTVTYYHDRDVVNKIKQAYPSSHISAIGIHVTVLPEITLRESQFDSIIRREPEITCLELAKHIAQQQDLTTVDGVSFKKGQEIYHNQERSFISDLNELPFPDRSLIDNKRYTLPIVNKPYTLIIPSRGCPYQCIFCTAHLYYGHKLRKRNPENIVSEIEEIIDKYGIKYITMWSDTFTLDRNFVLEICQQIKSKKLIFSWMCNSRVDKIDRQLLKVMHSAGCIGISYGVESGNQEILDNIKKDVSVNDIKNAFLWTRQAGIESMAHIIFGLPGESEETIKETINLVKFLQPDYAQFYCAIPFPGTEFYHLAKNNNWLVTKDWSKYELNQAIVETPLLKKEILAQKRIVAYRQFYLRPQYILGRLKKINSLPALITLIRQALNFTKSWIINI